jgi:phenylalanyl-tRNA synthetase beta chain
MIVSHRWLKAFVPHDRSAEEIGELLSRHCVTLDGIRATRADLAPFVVALVVERAPHPDSDRLSITKVDDGSGTLLDVVCGAPNVTAGVKYPFIRIGGTMPDGLKIERRKIRGLFSNGMLCSARELAVGFESDGILPLDTDAAPGTPLLDVLDAGDVQLDLDVLPNRPDLLCALGVAREVSALTGVALRMPEELPTVAMPAVVQGATEASADGVTVRIDDTASCPRYVAVVIRGVRVGESPAWLRERLEGIGSRSINNVVDATNYALLGLGQPTHAFDLATLAGNTIVVRAMRDGERLVTLDGTARAAVVGSAAICDAERPVAFAGVMGGRDSEVTEATTDILLEVAVFEPRFVRRVRRAVGLSTDASYRFERGVDAGATLDAAARTAALVTSVAGGTITAVIDVGSAPAPRAAVTLRPARLAALLGDAVPTPEIVRWLEAIGCTVTPSGDALAVTPPSWRHDLALEVDLVEEVARLRGFDVLPDDLEPGRPSRVGDDPLVVMARSVRDACVTAGLLETKAMPFTARGGDDSPRVLNPLAEDEPYLRASILDTLAGRAEYNLARMQGDVRLFEVGHVFLPSGGRLPREEVRAGALLLGRRRPPHFTEPEPPSFDAWDAKALATSMARAAWPGETVTLEPVAEGEVLWTVHVGGRDVGTVSHVPLDGPVWAGEAFGVEFVLGVVASDDVAPAGHHAHGATTDAPAARHLQVIDPPGTPAAEFDLALIVPAGVSAGAIEGVLRRDGGELLEDVRIFDEYRGDGLPAGTRSLAWRLRFRHPERTLKDKELEGRRQKLVGTLSKELGVTLRG